MQKGELPHVQLLRRSSLQLETDEPKGKFLLPAHPTRNDDTRIGKLEQTNDYMWCTVGFLKGAEGEHGKSGKLLTALGKMD